MCVKDRGYDFSDQPARPQLKSWSRLQSFGEISQVNVLATKMNYLGNNFTQSEKVLNSWLSFRCFYGSIMH